MSERAAIIEEIERLLSPPCKKNGAGFLTLRELCVKTRTSTATMRRRLHELNAAGKLEVGRKTGSGIAGVE